MAWSRGFSLHHVACVYRWGWLLLCFFWGRMSESEKFLRVSNYSTRGLADGVKKITPGLRHSSEVSVISCVFFRHVPMSLNDSTPRLPPPAPRLDTRKRGRERERLRASVQLKQLMTVALFRPPLAAGPRRFVGKGSPALLFFLDPRTVPRNHALMTPGQVRPLRSTLMPSTKTVVFAATAGASPGLGD